MDNAIWGMLNDTEKALLRAVEPKRLDRLDEDGLSDLHDKVRRARRKYAKLYRRRAAAEVVGSGSRSKAHERHARTLIKAEAFEEALEVVSRRLAAAAKASAAALKAERLAAARAAKGSKAGKGGKSGKGGTSAGGSKVGKGRKASASKTPVGKRKAASQRASKARKAAARG